MKQFRMVTHWDAEAEVWGSFPEIPISNEAPTLEGLELRASEIAQEIAEMNGVVAPGEQVKIRVVKEPVAAAS